MGISEKKMQIVINNYFKQECDVNTSIREAFEKGFRIGVKKTLSAQQEWIPCSERMPDEDYWTGADFQYSADVLMTVYNAEDEETIIEYGHTVDGSWYSDTTDCFVPSGWEVMAWMPLPEPWEGR